MIFQRIDGKLRLGSVRIDLISGFETFSSSFQSVRNVTTEGFAVRLVARTIKRRLDDARFPCSDELNENAGVEIRSELVNRSKS